MVSGEYQKTFHALSILHITPVEIFATGDDYLSTSIALRATLIDRTGTRDILQHCTEVIDELQVHKSKHCRHFEEVHLHAHKFVPGTVTITHFQMH
ncbi:hypothetical protein Pelo_3330 [Pelomyxa schiedti]|nr:hypothetical protein Pelo_3330 [Pelomyxa schiedti]